MEVDADPPELLSESIIYDVPNMASEIDKREKLNRFKSVFEKIRRFYYLILGFSPIVRVVYCLVMIMIIITPKRFHWVTYLFIVGIYTCWQLIFEIILFILTIQILFMRCKRSEGDNEFSLDTHTTSDVL